MVGDRNRRDDKPADARRRRDIEGAPPAVLLVRESPLHLGHLRTLTQLAEMGAIILPPVPAFYAEPNKISDIVDQMVGRMLDLFGYDWPDTKRWGEDLAKGRRRKKS